MLLPGDTPRPVTLHVQHNVEIAHRLLNLPGKCQNIHGHSLQVRLSVQAAVTNDEGYAIGADGTTVLEFGLLKKMFRAYLDQEWDHRLHLNENDPWARQLGLSWNDQGRVIKQGLLPGLQVWDHDPSTENIAWWINEHVGTNIVPGLPISIKIQETGTNGVSAP
jgi:6-pyruvoyltetrahydropterin/6-carboxytetrahydropterin synthase